MSEKIIELKSKNELDNYLKSQENLIVHFYADWCGSCRKIVPLLEGHTKYSNVLVVKVNVDNLEELATEYNVSGIPYVLFFKNGKQVDEFTGFNEAALQRMFENTK